MTLDQSALLELLEMLKGTDVSDRVRKALIDAELTAAIGAAPHERTPERTAQRSATAAGRRRSRPRLVI